MSLPINQVVGPGKYPKIINVGPTFIPESRVLQLSSVLALSSKVSFSAKKG